MSGRCKDCGGLKLLRVRGLEAARSGEGEGGGWGEDREEQELRASAGLLVGHVGTGECDGERCTKFSALLRPEPADGPGVAIRSRLVGVCTDRRLIPSPSDALPLLAHTRAPGANSHTSDPARSAVNYPPSRCTRVQHSMGHLLTVRAHLAAKTKATSKSSPGTAPATETHAQVSDQPDPNAHPSSAFTTIPSGRTSPGPGNNAPSFLLARLRLPGLLPLLGSSLAQDVYE
ncbi:hypothetical protein NUW54_g7391 [Trametes sanguinea]|uniref:Uncharacterized protein n=1 Tax=Trametes sanguinea TaxID=158606 RepID=A0ACC1PMC7_9APHY|nr:hypothetical protein NUW54_g7391 [Trametes sanguinea]